MWTILNLIYRRSIRKHLTEMRRQRLALGLAATA